MIKSLIITDAEWQDIDNILIRRICFSENEFPIGSCLFIETLMGENENLNIFEIPLRSLIEVDLFQQNNVNLLFAIISKKNRIKISIMPNTKWKGKIEILYETLEMSYKQAHYNIRP